MTPTTNPVAAYQAAVAEVQAVKRELEGLVQLVSDGAAKLQNWPGLVIVNSSVNFPGVPASSAEVLDSKTWPTMDRIAAVLVRWHQAKAAALSAWQAVPASQRKDLTLII